MRGTLRNRRQFQLVYEKGSKAVGRLLVAYAYRPEPAESERIGEHAVGVVASRKVGNAVARSRAKRRLREAYRQFQTRLHRPRWFVFIARQGLAVRDLSQDRILEDMERLLQQLEALSTSPGSSRKDGAPC